MYREYTAAKTKRRPDNGEGTSGKGRAGWETVGCGGEAYKNSSLPNIREARGIRRVTLLHVCL